RRRRPSRPPPLRSEGPATTRGGLGLGQQLEDLLRRAWHHHALRPRRSWSHGSHVSLAKRFHNDNPHGPSSRRRCSGTSVERPVLSETTVRLVSTSFVAPRASSCRSARTGGAPEKSADDRSHPSALAWLDANQTLEVDEKRASCS